MEVGEAVKRGAALTDGPSIRDGELALGQNMLVAYMIWDGFNFEDAIVVSERVVQKIVILPSTLRIILWISGKPNSVQKW